MWNRKRAATPDSQPDGQRLRDALRAARIESAERSGVIVDLRDAEIARLELLNEALDSIFAELPETADVFDRGLSRGEHPRLWIDMTAHVAMGRDKRTYRFMADTRNGPVVMAESAETGPIIDAVVQYVARRMIERERALADRDGGYLLAAPAPRRSHTILVFVCGLLLGVIAVFAAAAVVAFRH
jgi:hypothetical protein